MKSDVYACTLQISVNQKNELISKFFTSHDGNEDAFG